LSFTYERNGEGTPVVEGPADVSKPGRAIEMHGKKIPITG
jgi:hypothetical protein